MTQARSDDAGDRPGHDPISTAAVLGEPMRRALYEHVASGEAAVDRDQAAAATGIGRPLAAFHLERLVTAGLLEVEYRRRSGRTGPGAGRPAKFYRRTRGLNVELSLPPRQYRMAAEIFAEGLDRQPDGEARDQVRAAARERGAALAAAARGSRPSSGGRASRRLKAARRDELVAVLRNEGFEPTEDGPEIRLRNCPFDVLAAEHRGLTCSMNLALLEGLASSVGDTGLRAVAHPVEGSCCVRLVPS